MPKVIYTPKALEDLQEIKSYITSYFGKDIAMRGLKEITSTVRQLERFPKEGLQLEDIIDYPTDYHYLVVKPNYVIYRLESVVSQKKMRNTGANLIMMMNGNDTIK